MTPQRTALILSYLFVFVCQSQSLRSQSILGGTTSTRSSIFFYVGNDGATGFDYGINEGSFVYPRDEPNRHQYMFGSGFWFGTKKYLADSILNKCCAYTFNSLYGTSCFVPGLIRDGDTLFSAYKNQYSVYKSTEYDADGAALQADNPARWLMWDNDRKDTSILGNGRYWGYYVHTPSFRNRAQNEYPAYVSSEDFVCLYKDTDLRYYEFGPTIERARGYPLGLEVLQHVFSWNAGDLSSTIVISWDIRSISTDTLKECWFAYFADPDIASLLNLVNSTKNDRADFVQVPGTLGIRYAWTDTDAGEDAESVGVLGLSFLETPFVDKDGRSYISGGPFEQLGTSSSAVNTIDTEPTTDQARYDLISKGVFDKNVGPADIRTNISTGPFTIEPGQTLKFAVCLTIGGLSRDVKSGDTNSIRPIITNVRKAITRYYGSIGSIGSVDVNEVSEQSTLNLMPNPANNYIIVAPGILSDNQLDYTLTNTLGQLVETGTVPVSVSNPSFRLDCSRLCSGVYSVRVSDSKSVWQKMFQIIK